MVFIKISQELLTVTPILNIKKSQIYRKTVGMFNNPKRLGTVII